MSTPKAIAIASIWLGVGLSSTAGEVVMFVALSAVVATLIVAR